MVWALKSIALTIQLGNKMQCLRLPSLCRRLTSPSQRQPGCPGRQVPCWSASQNDRKLYSPLALCSSWHKAPLLSTSVRNRRSHRWVLCTASSAAAATDPSSNNGGVISTISSVLRQQAKAMEGMWGKFVPMVSQGLTSIDRVGTYTDECINDRY